MRYDPYRLQSGWLADLRSDMPFAQLFPIAITKPHLSDSTFCSGGWLPDLGKRWSFRLVATAAEDRLSFRRNPHTSFAAASD
jgi:hypothetical protein